MHLYGSSVWVYKKPPANAYVLNFHVQEKWILQFCEDDGQFSKIQLRMFIINFLIHNHGRAALFKILSIYYYLVHFMSNYQQNIFMHSITVNLT